MRWQEWAEEHPASRNGTCKGHEWRKQFAWENGLEGHRRKSRPDEGLLLQSRQEIRVIR